MAGSQTLSFWDYDKETSSVSIPTTEVTDLNYAAQDAAMDAFKAAVNGISLGFEFKETRCMFIGLTPGTAPNDPDAQREKKWLIQMHDAVTAKPHTMEIPCADLSLLDTQARGEIDKTLAAWVDIKAAIEALYLTDQGNAVVVDNAIFVGRNL